MFETVIQLGSLREAAFLRHPVAAGDDLYLERMTEDGIALLELAPGAPGREVARLARAHPERALIACEADAMICRENDDLLVSITRVGGQRVPLRRLEPSPKQIVVTPEHVMWTSGREVWRWWRENDTIERVAQCEDEPLLALRPVEVPYPPSRIAADVAIAAGSRIGLIDVEGLEWIGEAMGPIERVACTTKRIVAAVDREDYREIIECHLDNECVAVVYAVDAAVSALAATETRAFVATNAEAPSVRGSVNGLEAELLDIDLVRGRLGRRWRPDAKSWVRETLELATTSRGLVIADGFAGRLTDRVTFVPFQRSAPDAFETLRIQRWLPDGHGGEIVIAAQEWSAGAASGELPAGLTAQVNAALKVTVTAGETPPGIPYAGWQVSIGDHATWSAYVDSISPTALAIGRLVAILAPHVPPLAALAAL